VGGKNSEVARQVLDAVGRRDLDELIELTAPEVEWRSFFAALSGAGEYHGHDGMREYVRDLSEPWETLRPEPDDLIAVGDLVLAVGRIHYRGKGSGVQAETPAGWLFHFHDGKVVRFSAFKDPEKAVAALGRE
jgi:ketosteroid isomerase-like protein